MIPFHTFRQIIIFRNQLKKKEHRERTSKTIMHEALHQLSKTALPLFKAWQCFPECDKDHAKLGHKNFLPRALTHLRSQDVFEVIHFLHIHGLLFPLMAIVTQWHLLVVTVRSNTGEEKENKGGNAHKYQQYKQPLYTQWQKIKSLQI